MAGHVYIRNDVGDVSPSNVQGGEAGLDEEVLVARLRLAYAADSLVWGPGGVGATGGGRGGGGKEVDLRIKS